MKTECISADYYAFQNNGSLYRTWPNKLLSAVYCWWFNRRRRSIERHAIKHLLSLEDAQLRDIGIHRGDLEWTHKLPNSADATLELELIVRGGSVRRRR